MVFSNLCVFVIWTKVALALEGLSCRGTTLSLSLISFNTVKHSLSTMLKKFDIKKISHLEKE